MRTDLTLRARDGAECDVGVTAPEGTTFGAVASHLARLTGSDEPLWNGGRRVSAGMIIGRGALTNGAVLTCDRCATDNAGAPGARLDIVGGLGAGRSVALARRTLTVGRSRSCDVVLPDPQASRRHAVLAVTGAGVTVRDLGSTNGTLLDGVRITGDRLVEPRSVVRIGDTFLAITNAPGRSARTRAGARGTVLVNRQRRVRPDSRDRVIEQAAPPRVELSPRVQWIAATVPALAGVALAWVMHSLLFLALAALTPVALFASALGDRLHWRRGRRRAAAAHRHALLRTQDEITAALREEVIVRRTTDPDPAAVKSIARSPTTRLWERDRHDADLLRVRIGLGCAPSHLRVSRGATVAPAATLNAVPSTVDLGRGPVGIAAPAPIRQAIARWVVGQLAVLTSPADVEIALVLDDDTPWTWTRWLPHVIDRVARTAADRDALADDLADLTRARRDGPTERSGWTGSRVVVVLDRVGALSGVARLSAVIRDATAVGVTALCLEDHAHDLPAMCTQLVRAADEMGSTVEIGGAVVVADRVDVSWAEGIARALAPMADGQGEPSASLPAQCRLVELLETQPPSAAGIAERWRRSDGSASTVLGMGIAGPIAVDLDRDGPHALIAGTTGAGKSELLQTLVTGLASAYPPSELTFLLVDYKGGAAFSDCAELPHTVGLVTDLDEHLTRRVLASLDSEIRRREALLAAAGTPDLAAYRARGATLPRLILVVDEFATLVEEFAGFVPGLVAIAQRGRSLGLHLVLATQRPSGVVSPEIRANTSVRIAMRVTSAADSLDVIDSVAAAGIHRRTPGRGYLRIGTTTMPFQAARVAAAGHAGSADRIRVEVLGAWRGAAEAAAGADDTDLRRYVRAIREAARDETPPRRPWLPPLPAAIAVTELPSSSEAPPAQVPLGLVDLPAEQRQETLVIDLQASRPVLIVGSARSGRSSALLTLAFAAARRCSPAALQMHAIDSGGALAELDSLPHLGTRAAIQAMDLVARLVQRLQADLARRRAAADGEPVLLLIVDGWDQLLAASEDYDGGRTVERLLAMLDDAPAARCTIVVTGGRAALAPRLAAQIADRFVLPMHDRSDYAQAGIDHRHAPGTAAPATITPGRGIRVADGAEFQIARPGAVPDPTRWGGVPSSALRLRTLPRRVALPDLPPPRPGRWLIGVGGDDAMPVVVDPTAGAARMLIAGPARSGRSTLLCSILQQVLSGTQNGGTVLVAARAHSPLAVAACDAGVAVLGPGHPPPEFPTHGLLVVDDAEAFAETAMGTALTEWIRADAAGRGAVVAGRSDALAVAFRGLGAEIKQSRCGVLLQPGPVDGELLGVSLPRVRSSGVPGRGVLVPDPSWGLGHEPLPVQVAVP